MNNVCQSSDILEMLVRMFLSNLCSTNAKYVNQSHEDSIFNTIRDTEKKKEV